ncbi:MAG: hypothetical protein HC812_17405 [Leptolyngbya sp. RL_3_1]|nr:hypothetical protein [Leptolyngbya sp. RL_3_1]
MVLPEIALTFAFEKVGEALLTGIDAQLNPGEVEGFLKQALQAAHGKEKNLFYFSFQKEGLQGYDKFLNQFFKGPARRELQKPLVGQGKPDVAMLCAALEQAVQGHSKLKEIDISKIQPWMTVFVETYFRETHRYLEFQVIKADYCDQIRRVFDDVKFAGIAVEGQDIDRAERLAEIFVMPDVREEGAAARELPEELTTQLENAPEMIPFRADRQQKLLWEQRKQILQAKNRAGGRTFSAADLLTQSKTYRAVLLGAPGSGKTTLMNYFAVVGTAHTGEAAAVESGESDGLQGKLNLPIATCIPIIIRIRDLARHPELSILEFVKDFAEKDLVVTRDLTGFFEYYLENGNALILLDGLDEVAEVAQRYRWWTKSKPF